MLVIPALDLLGGKAVRLRQGRYEDVTVYSDHPEELCLGWVGTVPRLHVVDLEGARAGQAVQKAVVQRIVAAFGAGVQVGGGVRSLEAVESYFDLGVERVVLGTAAVTQPELVAQACERYPGRIIVSLDAEKGWVRTQGWESSGGRRAQELAAELAGLPLAAFLYTDIERDGTEVGPNLAETRALTEHTAIPVIASGGVGTLLHLSALAQLGSSLCGAIVGRALLEKRFSLADAVRAAQPEVV